MEERTLVLIKPDAMAKRLAGNILSELDQLRLKMIGLKLVNVKKELAEEHYVSLKDRPFFEDLIKYSKLDTQPLKASIDSLLDSLKQTREEVQKQLDYVSSRSDEISFKDLSVDLNMSLEHLDTTIAFYERVKENLD